MLENKWQGDEDQVWLSSTTYGCCQGHQWCRNRLPEEPQSCCPLWAEIGCFPGWDAPLRSTLCSLLLSRSILLAPSFQMTLFIRNLGWLALWSIPFTFLVTFLVWREIRKHLTVNQIFLNSPSFRDTPARTFFRQCPSSHPTSFTQERQIRSIVKWNYTWLPGGKVLPRGLKWKQPTFPHQGSWWLPSGCHIPYFVSYGTHLTRTDI